MPADYPLQRYRVMPIVQSIMSMCDLELVEMRFTKPYSVEKDAVTTSGPGTVNEVTLVFQSKFYIILVG